MSPETLLKSLLQWGILIFLATESTAPPAPILNNGDKFDSRVDNKILGLYGFSVIRNSTIPCSAIHQTERLLFRKHELTDEDKLAILEMKGGKMMKYYMAANKEDAKANFLEFLDIKYQALGQVNNDEAPGGRAVGTSPGRNNPEARTGRRSSGRTSRDRSRPGSDVGPSDGNLTRHIQHQPYSFPGDLGLQGTTLVNQPGSVTELGNCMYRGARTYIPGETGDFLLLCSTCSAITHMSDDVWPRFINEAHCIIQDRHCFIVENTNHGVCQQKIMPLNILRKKEGYCSLALADGEVVIVDEWEIFTKLIGIGCECVIYANSIFAEYVGKYQTPN